MLNAYRMTSWTTLPLLALAVAVSGFIADAAFGQDRRSDDDFRSDRIDRVRQEREARDRESDRQMDRDRPERREIDDRPRDERMDWERRQREMQMHRTEMEMHHLHVERIASQARIANDEVLAASFALEHLPELVRNPQERREIMIDMMHDSDNPAIKRLIRMKLIEYTMHSDRRDEALEHVRALILQRPE